MKYLTTYLDDEINFKFGNNGSIIELKAVDDHAVMSFSNEEKLLIRIKNEESYIKTVPVTAERKIIQLPTKLLKDLTVGQYDVELWQGEGDDQVIYPDEGFLRLKIHGNASQIDGSLVSSITLADFERKFNELAQKIEGKLEKLPDIDGKNISIDVKVVDGNLCINGKDTGINLTAKDGRDGRDGHTPEITVSDAGTLVVDGIDTNKSLIGPRGENGLPGKDGVAGQDGKSAYQVAVDNGFDGTEVEWLRSLHGNDGLDGKSGRDGLPGQSGKSAYEIAITNGFTGTETEWLESLKGRDGHDGKDANVDLSKYPTKDEIANQYVQRTDLPNIVLDTDQRTLIINNKEIKIPNSIDLSNYAQKSEIPKIVFDVENNMLTINGNEVKIPKDVDLSVYYTKADIDEKIATVQSGGKIDLSNYVTQQELSEYVKKTDIPVVPDLAPYETKENAERTYATKEEVANIQLTPGKNGLSAYELAKKDGFHGTEIEWLASLKGKDANPTLVLNTIHDKGFWGDTTIRNSFDPQINIVTTKPLKVGNLASITIDNVVLPGKAAIGVGTLEGSTYTFAYCKVADLSVGDTTIQLDWPIQNDNYYLFVSGKPFQTRGNGDVDAGSRFKYMLADTRNYDTGNRIKVDGESLGSFKYNFVLNYTGKTRIDLEQILKNTMPYANKKITFLGDSVTSGGTTSNGKQAFSYVDYLKDYLGAEITNKGLSGSVITEGNIENQTQSFVSRSNQIQDQDFVTIFGGINDFWFNSPLGSMEYSSDNVQSFYGALKFLVENLSKKNPIAHFLFVTPLKECKEGAPHTYEDNNKLVLHKNRAGFTEEDYVNAIKEVAAYYSVPVLDLFNSSNMNPYIESQRQYFADDLHPNQLGAQRLALIISQAINNGISSGFTRSVNGKNGLSPYQIAQKNGFEGSEIKWLESLKGKDGRDGSDAHVDLSDFLTKETANSEYAKKNEVPLIVYDAENKVLTINGQNVEIPSSVDLSNYITKTDADKYALKSDVKNIVLDKDKRTLTVGKESIDIPNNIDLSPYYTKEEIDKKLTDIATNGKVDLTGYLRQSDLTDYAKKSDIPSQPDLTPYAKKTEIPQVSIDMEKRTITLNGNTIDIPSSVDLTDYAKKSEIPSIVLDGETNTLTINGTKVVIPGNVDLTPYYTKGEIDEKLADIQSGGKIDLSNYVNKQELDGYAKKSEIPSAPDLTPYETKENAEKTYATKQALADIQLTPGKDGKNGKSAYDIAKEHGYTDTEENWLKSLKGRDGIDGKSGQNGVNGLSAYEVAQKNGFSGTEQEWLASLRGERGSAGIQGVPGESGKSAYEIWKSLGNSGSEQDFVNSLKGEAGKNGSDGVRGETGQSAYQLWLSKGNSGSEEDFLQSLRGGKGDTGSRGSDGAPGKSGLSAYEIWKNAGHQGTEQDFLNSLRGSQGERGSQGVPGPAGGDGLSAYEVAKRNGFQGTEQEWLSSLKGERGEAGLRGPKGDPGQIPDVSNINKGISDNKSDISKINLKMSTMFVNLLDFGAQPENVNFDNAPAFNKAIQALPSVGGTIFIPNGNYFLKSTVNIDRSYVHVMGLNHGLRSGIDPVDGSTQAGGGGAKVTVQNPITAFKLENTHNNNRLSGITFSGFDLRGDTNAGVGIDGISNTDRVVIDNMTINNVGIGVRLHAADAPRITNSWIAETQSSILLTGASQQAEIKNNSLGAQPKGTTIYMENPDRFNISGNNIYPDGASAIRILNPVHGSIVGNTISAYYNGMIEFLPNSDGAFGNGNVISGNVIALESWHDNPDGKDNKWGIVHIQAFNNVIAGNNILANGTPTNTTGILVMKGDYNRISSNVMTIEDTNSKVVINGAANNNWVIYSTEGSAFQDGGNQSNKNIGI